MDNDYSSSSDESSDGSYSSEESTRLEDCRINGVTIQLPAGLCENKEIFDEFFSYRNLQEHFTDQQKRDLLAFLPTFPENDRKEKEETLRKLFSGENMRFGAPLADFHARLKNGYFRPDIAKMRSVLRRSRARDNRQRLKIYYSKLVKDVLVSRQRLLERSLKLPPGATVKMERLPQASAPRAPLAEQRTKRRYFEELTAIRKEIGESDHSSQDENYPEGPPSRVSKKQRRQLAALAGWLAAPAVTNTLAQRPAGLDLAALAPAPGETAEDGHRAALARHRRRRNARQEHPELNTTGLTLEAVRARSAGRKAGPAREAAAPPRMKKKPRSAPPLLAPAPAAPATSTQAVGGAGSYAPDSSATDPGDSDEECDDRVSLSLEGRQRPGEASSPVPAPVPAAAPAKPAPRKRAGSLALASPSAATSAAAKTQRRDSPKKIKSEPVEALPSPSLELEPEGAEPAEGMEEAGEGLEGRPRHTPATLSDLDGIDMMNLPVDLDDIADAPVAHAVADDDDTDHDVKPRLELMQDTHCCFFALLRDVICSTPEHRMDLPSIEDRLRSWQQNPISPLNHWYSLSSDWPQQLSSAVTFLCGDYADAQPSADFVPYLEFKAAERAYQWIGAGRDSDGHLQPLCAHWLHNRDQMAQRPANAQPDADADDTDTDDRSASPPPPPRCPTAWSIRATSDEEKMRFREQEAARYRSPHRAFTFRMHDYESVVGPVKGIYNPAAGGLKPARGHSLLVAERPGFVTILCLVRDATARLPNGEGTRTDICELLKDSQYLAAVALESYLHSVVSGALDRLHYETDPCVKYDTKRKIWIYLHRGRTEEEFERMHQQFQGVAKTKKTSTNRKPTHRPRKEREVSAGKPPTLAAASAGEGTAAAADAMAAQAGLSVCEETAPAETAPPPAPSPAPGPAPGPAPSPGGIAGGKPNRVARTVQVVAPKPVQPIQAASPGTLLTGGKLVQPMAGAAGVKSLTLTPAQLQLARTVSAQRAKVAMLQAQRLSSPRATQIVGQGSPRATQVVVTHATPRATQVGGQAIPRAAQVAGHPSPRLTQMVTQGSPRAAQMLTQGSPRTTQMLTQGSPRTTQMTAPPVRVQTIGMATQAMPKAQPAKSPALARAPAPPPGAGVRLQQASAVVASAASANSMGLVGLGQKPVAAGAAQTSPRPPMFVSSGKPGAVKTAIRVANPATAAAILRSKQLQQQQQKQLLLQKQSELATSLANQQQLQMQAQQQQQRQKAKVTAMAQMQQLKSGAAGSSAGGRPAPQVVGKVQLANVQGQVISVESLLAHRKQHGTLPQGTALRVSGGPGSKPGQTNLIQIPSSTPGGQPQYAVVSQGNLVSVGQPRMLHQQMGMAGVRHKVSGTNIRMVSAGAGAGTGTVRMLSAPARASLRVINPALAGAGKPVLLASKAQAGGQNVYLTTQAGAGGQGQTVVLASQALRGQGGHLVLQQGGTQQILLPPGFQGGTLNIKTLQGLQGLQGLKVIPMSQANKAGRQQVYARIINPAVRPTLLQPPGPAATVTAPPAPAPASVATETAPAPPAPDPANE